MKIRGWIIMVAVMDIKENEDLLLDKVQGSAQDLLPPKVLELLSEPLEVLAEIEKASNEYHNKIVLSQEWDTFRIPIYTYIGD